MMGPYTRVRVVPTWSWLSWWGRQLPRSWRGRRREHRRLPAHLAARLREAREAAGLSQRQVAERIAASRRFVSYLERGERSPSIRIARKLAAALDLTAGDVQALELAIRPFDGAQAWRRTIKRVTFRMYGTASSDIRRTAARPRREEQRRRRKTYVSWQGRR